MRQRHNLNTPSLGHSAGIADAGQLYVYRDEDRHAVAVARWRTGPKGGMTADTIARMAVPGKHVTQDELNNYAAAFAAAPDLLEALESIQFTATNHGGEFDNDPAYLLNLIHKTATTAVRKVRNNG